MPARDAPAIAAEPQHHARRPHIAQRAGTVLHVGLELVQRVVELAVALIGERHERVENLRPPHRRRRFHDGLEPVGEIAVARERPKVHEREQIFRIGRVEAIEIGKLAHVVPDLEPQIPQRMQQRLDEALLGTADGRAEHHEQIDVGMEELGFAAVPADRADGERRLRVRARAVDELADDAVDALGVAGESRAPSFAALGGVDQLAPRLVERRRKAEPQAPPDRRPCP